MSPAQLRLRLAPLAGLLLILAAAGCASPGSSGPVAIAAEQPVVSVERFLLAANTRDLDAMAALFGNADGPISSSSGSAVSCVFRRMGSWVGMSRACTSWQEIELRMNAIAEIIRHDDYRMVSENAVAGRTASTIRVGVDLHRGTLRYRDVAFVAVRQSSGRWLIQEIDLEAVTGAR
jgi:hypothetical protein